MIGYNLEEIKNTLRFDFDFVSKWFEENYMVLNVDKCHFMCLGKDTENQTFIFNNFIFNNSNEDKILGITNNNKLTLTGHINILCRKAAQKVGSLSRLLNHLSDSQKGARKNAPRKNAPGKSAPPENYPPEINPPGKMLPRKLPPTPLKKVFCKASSCYGIS